MHRTIALAAGIIAATLALPAAAADIPARVAKAPPPAAAPLFNWTGFYAGVHAGYGWGETDVTPLNGGENEDLRGWVFGGQIGYNVQTGNWVWGIEADGAWSGMDNDAGPGPAPPEGFVDVKSLFTVRGRGGFAANNALYYLTAGWAGARVLYNDFDAFAGSLTKWHHGYAVGGGVEYAFAPNWSGKLEYLFVDLGDKVYPLGTPDRVDVQTHLIRAGLNYRFATY